MNTAACSVQPFFAELSERIDVQIAADGVRPIENEGFRRCPESGSSIMNLGRLSGTGLFPMDNPLGRRLFGRDPGYHLPKTDEGASCMKATDTLSGKIRSVAGASLRGELRSSFRQKTYLNGRILFNLGRSTMSVRIRDLSVAGTKVCLSIPWPCPPRFTLEIDHPSHTSPRIEQCEIVWQHGMAIGARFIGREKCRTRRSFAS